LTRITLGPSLTGLRGTQVTGSIIYTLVTLRTSYNTEIAQYKHTIQYKHSQIRQAIENCWFNILDFLRYGNKRDMAKIFWIARYRFESLDGKVKDLRELNYPKYK
jgi:hypothetical protein